MFPCCPHPIHLRARINPWMWKREVKNHDIDAQRIYWTALCREKFWKSAKGKSDERMAGNCPARIKKCFDELGVRENVLLGSDRNECKRALLENKCMRNFVLTLFILLPILLISSTHLPARKSEQKQNNIRSGIAPSCTKLSTSWVSS